jgi:hypothetical protein
VTAALAAPIASAPGASRACAATDVPPPCGEPAGMRPSQGHVDPG